MSTILVSICGASLLCACVLVVPIALIVFRYFYLRGENTRTPRKQTAPSAPQVAEPSATATPTFSVPIDPQSAFDLGLALVAQSQRAQASECFLFVFRNGSPELR